MINFFKVILLTIIGILYLTPVGISMTNIDEQFIGISMRTIGHEILINSGDSTSRILPVEKNMNQYKIQFENEFSFNPEELFETIDSVMRDAGVKTGYIVEVENCKTKSIVYSYKTDSVSESYLIPCKTRLQPKDCYSIYITILDLKQSSESSLPVFGQSFTNGPNSDKPVYYSYLIWSAISGSLLFTAFVYFRRRNQLPEINSDIISLGKFEFDKKNMTLTFEEEKTVLTSKESDLLLLFHASANSTLKREEILKNVWGNEGDYVGRTLDVFISKLRKKLSADQNLKIINIRGIGYKFVINDSD